MTRGSGAGEHPARRRIRLLPREHGFWVILAVVVLSAVSRGADSGAAWLATALVVLGAVAFAGLVARFVRRSEWLQIGSAAALSSAGIPIQLVAGIGLRAALFDAAAWVVVFTASALGVRASFARASRSRDSSPTGLAIASVLFPGAAAVTFALASHRAHAAAALVAAVGLAALALLRPGVKQMRAIGLSLAAIAVAAGLALDFL